MYCSRQHVHALSLRGGNLTYGVVQFRLESVPAGALRLEAVARNEPTAGRGASLGASATRKSTEYSVLPRITFSADALCGRWASPAIFGVHYYKARPRLGGPSLGALLPERIVLPSSTPPQGYHHHHRRPDNQTTRPTFATKEGLREQLIHSTRWYSNLQQIHPLTLVDGRCAATLIGLPTQISFATVGLNHIAIPWLCRPLSSSRTARRVKN